MDQSQIGLNITRLCLSFQFVICLINIISSFNKVSLLCIHKPVALPYLRVAASRFKSWLAISSDRENPIQKITSKLRGREKTVTSNLIGDVKEQTNSSIALLQVCGNFIQTKLNILPTFYHQTKFKMPTSSNKFITMCYDNYPDMREFVLS